MNYDEYYKAVKALKLPDNLNLFEQADYIRVETNKLKKKLSASDLQKIVENEKRWQNKVDSSHKS